MQKVAQKHDTYKFVNFLYDVKKPNSNSKSVLRNDGVKCQKSYLSFVDLLVTAWFNCVPFKVKELLFLVRMRNIVVSF